QYSLQSDRRRKPERGAKRSGQAAPGIHHKIHLLIPIETLEASHKGWPFFLSRAMLAAKNFARSCGTRGKGRATITLQLPAIASLIRQNLYLSVWFLRWPFRQYDWLRDPSPHSAIVGVGIPRFLSPSFGVINDHAYCID